ncbi:MerR family transcriptional regulator [Streptomyces sp. MST-110588]|uniref:MerR family transcriptional regulator n=1 Tax=Streptomyces sp. MST-110588 TaxID=2833628 RepID=UPI001F5E29E4|nr:MerR family transcriptional regulator [Streptomyces sp. MST-110588]UNO43595.1 MerR family transcriptional regulator [Streptomyces sp. MST-110588]
MRIGELAKEAGVSTRALRYYEQRGLLRPRRQHNGYREYDESAVTRVLNIRTLLAAGLNAESIKKMNACLDGDTDHAHICSEAIVVYERRLQVVREQVVMLSAMQRKLEDALRHLRTGISQH